MARDNGAREPELAHIVMNYLNQYCRGPENAKTPQQIAQHMKLNPMQTWADLHPGPGRGQNLNAELEKMINLDKSCVVPDEDRARVYRQRFGSTRGSYYYFVL
jgi:hypothetical protein